MYEYLFRQQDLEDGLPPAVSFTFLSDEETRAFDLLESALADRAKLQKEVSGALGGEFFRSQNLATKCGSSKSAGTSTPTCSRKRRSVTQQHAAHAPQQLAPGDHHEDSEPRLRDFVRARRRDRHCARRRAHAGAQFAARQVRHPRARNVALPLRARAAHHPDLPDEPAGVPSRVPQARRDRAADPCSGKRTWRL